MADDELSFDELRRAAIALSGSLVRGDRIAVVADRRLETIVAVVAGLMVGATVVPLDPDAAPGERAHQLTDSRPTAVLHPADVILPADIDTELDLAVDLALLLDRAGDDPTIPPAPSDDEIALVMYTSGTTGRPKGAELSHAAVAANLDALARAWQWQADDVLVHALPLYHVHGLVLGVLGPLRRGSSLRHLGAFSVGSTVAALQSGATVHFGVPTIYHRLAAAAEHDPAVVDALRRARLLVSGSAGLPPAVHAAILARTGHTIVERYGMTETLITTAVPAGTLDKAGTVGPALPGVELRVLDDDGADVPPDATTMGELHVRTPSAFSGYLNRPDATDAAWRDGWFVTGDVATIDADGYVRIVGRDSTDIIKSGGFKIGTGEIEDVLLLHPAIVEAAVVGVPDDDFGQRVEAWIVARPIQPTGPGDRADGDRTGDRDSDADLDPDLDLDLEEVDAHVAAHLTPHKRPRRYHVVDALPRNALGKVQKARLVPTAPT
jgi:malonyl-CoA/methylmalonyl-CoA synthetase